MRKKARSRRYLIGLAFAACAALCAAYAASWIGNEMALEEKQLLREQVQQAAVSCYASEGRFPQTLSHLVDNYGLIYDQERYLIWYDAFASNVMPDIDVSVRGEEHP